MKYGVVHTADGQEHYLRFFRVHPDSIAYVRAQLSPVLSNDVVMALYVPAEDAYYGFLFRNDSCYYFHHQTFHFMHLYSDSDTFEIVRCGEDFSYRKNGTEDFVFSRAVQSPMEVIVRNTSSQHTTGYIEYGFLDTCSITTIETSHFYELNILPSGSYAIVTGDTTDSIKNRYGSNIYAIDLTPYSLSDNVLYEIEVYHLNKERTYYFRFKRLK